MKYRNKILILSAILLIGILKYVPLFYYPKFLQDIYYNNGLIVFILSFLLLLGLVFKWRIRLFEKLIFILLPLIILFSSSKIADINNQIIIKYNTNREVYSSPIVGVKIDTLSNLGEKVFVFNKQFGVFDALVYSPNHGLDSESWEFKNESSFYKIYNSDWWWYKHND